MLLRLFVKSFSGLFLLNDVNFREGGNGGVRN